MKYMNCIYMLYIVHWLDKKVFKSLALFDNVLPVAHSFCKIGKLQNVIRHIVALFLCFITHSAKKAYRAH